MLEYVSTLIENCREKNHGFRIAGSLVKNGSLYYIVILGNNYGKGIEYSLRGDALTECSLKSSVSEEEYRKVIENIPDILENAVFGICDCGVKSSLRIFEDNTGIHRAHLEDLENTLFIWSTSHNYIDRYTAIADELIGPGKHLSYNHFYGNISKREPSLSLSEAFEYLKNHPEEFTLGEHPVLVSNEPVISVSISDIRRRTGNTNKKTFDFISVELLLRSDLKIKDMRAYIRNNMQYFNQKAIEKLEKTKKYTSFGVPTSYLELYSIGFNMGAIKMMYELPEVI